MRGLAALGLGIGGGKHGRQIVAQAVRYESFVIQAQSVGLTVDQAKAMIEKAALERGNGYDDVMDRADRHLQSFIENGYLVVALRDLLTADELAVQPFAADTVLNAWNQVPQPLGQLFAQMGREEQRTYIKNAIAFAQMERLYLASALALLLAQAYAPPPRYLQADGAKEGS